MAAKKKARKKKGENPLPRGLNKNTRKLLIDLEKAERPKKDKKR